MSHHEPPPTDQSLFRAATAPSSQAGATRAAPSPAPRWFVGLGILALAGYAILLGRNSTIAAGGSDASGYLNSARLLASGRLESPTRLPPAFAAADMVSRLDFQPLGFSTLEGGTRQVTTYPSGLPPILHWPEKSSAGHGEFISSNSPAPSPPYGFVSPSVASLASTVGSR